MDIDLSDSFTNNFVIFIKGSLIFVVSQAWNSAIQDLIGRFKFFENYGKILYALLITFISIYVLRIISKTNKLIDKCKDRLSCILF